MTRAERIELARLLKKLGQEIEPDERAETNRTDAGNADSVRNFYMPKVPKNFYYDPKVFRKLLGIR